MVSNLPRQPDVYFITELLLKNWDATRTQGFDPNDSPSSEGFLDSADSFEKTGPSYPQFTVQSEGAESSGGDTTYDFISSSGPGQNRVGTLTAQVRVEDKTDSNVGYTGDSNTYSEISAEKLARKIRQEIERICIDNPTAPGTDFSFVGAVTNEIPDQPQDTRVVRRDGATISYGWLRD